MEDSHRREVVVGGDDAHHVLHRDPVHRMVMVVGKSSLEAWSWSEGSRRAARWDGWIFVFVLCH